MSIVVGKIALKLERSIDFQVPNFPTENFPNNKFFQLILPASCLPNGLFSDLLCHRLKLGDMQLLNTFQHVIFKNFSI